MAPDATPNLQLDRTIEASHCFAVNYTGYLLVHNDSSIHFLGPPDDSLYNKFKVRTWSTVNAIALLCNTLHATRYLKECSAAELQKQATTCSCAKMPAGGIAAAVL